MTLPIARAARVLVSVTSLFALACSGQITGGAQNAVGGAAGVTAPGPMHNSGNGGSSAAGGEASAGSDASAGDGPLDPGDVVLRRLNRAEYNNTVADLLHTTLRPADEFPEDDLGDEFSTVGSALSLSPIYVEHYENAAYALIDDLFADPERLSEIVRCDVAAEGMACVESTLAAFARRAFRRPATEEELESLSGPYTTAVAMGLSPQEALKLSLTATLISPYFIFKVELRDPTATGFQRINAFELATRLSYALWSTMPDDALSALADDGSLIDDAVLDGEVTRMLADPRADALLETFAAEWIGLRRLDTHEVDTELYGDYNDELVAAMKEETRLYFREFLRSDQPLTALLAAPFTFIDSTLADHYGLPAPDDEGFSRVDTSATARRGLLSLGAVLTSTSLSSRTSPVKRGEFVASRLLCIEISPPPDGIPALSEPQPGVSLRERMEAHRSNPACSGCHSIMDPIGFGLENFDAVGVYRTEDSGDDIDASGVLPNGMAFSGPTELGAALAADPQYLPCVTSKLATFAVGRLFETRGDDEAWIAELAERAAQDGGTLESLIRELVQSELFRSAR